MSITLIVFGLLVFAAIFWISSLILKFLLGLFFFVGFCLFGVVLIKAIMNHNLLEAKNGKEFVNSMRESLNSLFSKK